MATGEGGDNKISFGFSKSIKKPATIKIIPEQPKVEFIECFDEKTIKTTSVSEKENDLVIPMRGPKLWYEGKLNNRKENIIEPKTVQSINGDCNNVNIEAEISKDASGITVITLNNDVEPTEVVTVKEEIPEGPAKSLEEQAAQEILRDLHLQGEKTEEDNISVVPLPKNEAQDKEEATLEDYEENPVEKFGAAMLRGMGWQPDRGIGKNAKIVPLANVHLRPRGLGLGADTRVQVKASKLAENQDLKIVKGAFVKFIIGRYIGQYGQIEGIDDEDGRLIIKLAIGEATVDANEASVQLISKTEYEKNAKVLNLKKYEYQIKAEKKNAIPEEILIEDSSEEDNSKSERNKPRNGKYRDQRKLKKYKQYSSDDDSESRRRFKKRRNSDDSEEDYKRKKSKKNKQRSSDEDSESEGRSRKRRNSSDSEEDHKLKKSKKTKKSKKRNSSSERNSHKSKKKYKERERESRDSPKRNKHRHRRSRSRSLTRR